MNLEGASGSEWEVNMNKIIYIFIVFFVCMFAHAYMRADTCIVESHQIPRRLIVVSTPDMCAVH